MTAASAYPVREALERAATDIGSAIIYVESFEHQKAQGLRQTLEKIGAALTHHTKQTDALRKSKVHQIVYDAAMHALEIGAPGLKEAGRGPIAASTALRATFQIVDHKGDTGK
jgi:hypothetical protein